ncbi:hypothetical protein [Alkalihalobacillus sp. TS-13]|uniref:hypothetical protein n=1 Tax=Alkalihalobacillus sp. TS-13 TaxID=2842455 RepID=UPI0021A9AB7A|nr:hypothetical protein [Alkalihalobacillus sp. TS-13]
MVRKFHCGELAVQKQAGAMDMACKVGSETRDYIPAHDRKFYRTAIHGCIGFGQQEW